MGKELSYKFDHTEIKNTGYNPKGLGKIEHDTQALKEKGIAVLEGKANIGVVIRDEPPASARMAPGQPRPR